MEIKSLILALILLLLVECVYADYYLDLLKDLDVKLLCILSWVAPLVLVFLLVLGGYVLISGTSPERREMGKGLIKNAIIGLLLVILLIMASIDIGGMQDLYWSMCWGI